jgi:hypothetical protein
MSIHTSTTQDPGSHSSGSVGGSGESQPRDDGHLQAHETSRSRHTSPNGIFNPYYTGRPRSSNAMVKHEPINRQEIIRRIKSRENGSRPGSPELERSSSPSGRKGREAGPLPSLIDSTPARPRSREGTSDNLAAGMQIERPKSALHRGDFREQQGTDVGFGRFTDVVREEQRPSILSTSPVAPWHSSFPAAAFRQAWLERRQPPPPQPILESQSPARSRAVSNVTLASSFTYKPPTSPLVHQSRPDTPDPQSRPLSPTFDKSRRHTFSPDALKRISSAALEYPASARGQESKPIPALRKDATYPYQAHQPRRSLHSFNSLPQSPSPASRRPSISDSPIQHAHMVGSYEESILRGRMSTTPSKPLNFVAQIGVLGKGDCSSKLRCPPHAHIPFPAVFYSYGPSDGQGWQSEEPSPYVGLVDLENNLPSAEPAPEKRGQRMEERLQHPRNKEGIRISSKNRGEEGSTADPQAIRRIRQKQKRRSGSPKAPPGGSYRIPRQGQLQIVIKNPNKTAVKLFLVPYDLSDMEPGQKTFIRQRSYSAGPIVDMPLSSRSNLGTDRPEASLPTSDDPNERPTLRYLLHLHICCPAKGRYFLYKSIRIVFANRVPDGKERLRNEIQLPEPRYSAYKPARDSNIGAGNTLGFGDGAWAKTAVFDGGPRSTPTAITRRTAPMDVDKSHLQIPSPPSESLSSRQVSAKWNYGSSNIQPHRDVDPFTFQRDHSWESGNVGEVKNESLLSRRLKGLEFRRIGGQGDLYSGDEAGAEPDQVHDLDRGGDLVE